VGNLINGVNGSRYEDVRNSFEGRRICKLKKMLRYNKGSKEDQCVLQEGQDTKKRQESKERQNSIEYYPHFVSIMIL
jgi:hypothetical protein